MTWVKIDDQFADHPKFVGLSDQALALWLRALAYVNRHLTDGEVPRAALVALTRGRKSTQTTKELVNSKLWVETESGFSFHDFHEWNDSAEQVRAKREKRRDAGRSGGIASASSRTTINDSPSNDQANAKQIASPIVDGCFNNDEAKTNDCSTLSTPTPNKREKGDKPPDHVVREVFESYLVGWRKHRGHGIEPRLTNRRRQLVLRQLKEHPREQLIAAAAGIWRSEWHLEKRFTDFDLALRDAEHIERFSQDTVTPNGPGPMATPHLKVRPDLVAPPPKTSTPNADGSTEPLFKPPATSGAA